MWPDGTLRWKLATAEHVASTPALARRRHRLRGLRRTTRSTRSRPTARRSGRSAPAATSTRAPAIGADGTIYVGSDDHALYAITPDGTVAWKRDHRRRHPRRRGARRRRHDLRRQLRQAASTRSRRPARCAGSSPPPTRSIATPGIATERHDPRSAPKTSTSTRSRPTARCAGMLAAPRRRRYHARDRRATARSTSPATTGTSTHFVNDDRKTLNVYDSIDRQSSIACPAWSLRASSSPRSPTSSARASTSTQRSARRSSTSSRTASSTCCPAAHSRSPRTAAPADPHAKPVPPPPTAPARADEADAPSRAPKPRAQARARRGPKPPRASRRARAARPRAGKPAPRRGVRSEPARRRSPRRSRGRAAKPTTPARRRRPPPKPTTAIIGRITVHPAGYGFVAPDDGETVFVPAKYRGTSLDGDHVAIDTWPGVRGTEGRVAEVLARGRAQLTGILRRVGRAMLPRARRSAHRRRLRPRRASTTRRRGKDGQAVVVEITRYPDAARERARRQGAQGARRSRRSAHRDREDPRLRRRSRSSSPTRSLAQAERTPQELRRADLADRIDLRDRRFATIDPETARDFDDAVCIEDGPHGGPRLWVAVADVSHYVRWGDAARSRGARSAAVASTCPIARSRCCRSQLSARHLLAQSRGRSLRDGRADRLRPTTRDVVDDDYCARGDPLARRGSTTRASRRRSPATSAASASSTRRGCRELRALDALAQQAARAAPGARLARLRVCPSRRSCSTTTIRASCATSSSRGAIRRSSRRYQLVEEFMLAANEAVGTLLPRARRATRCGASTTPPDRGARGGVRRAARRRYGITVDVDEARTPLGMKRVLDQLDGQARRAGAVVPLLRTLKQAVYDVVPIGHFGLASARLPALHVADPALPGSDRPPPAQEPAAPRRARRRAAATASRRRRSPSSCRRWRPSRRSHERRAMEAEREVVAMYRAFLMRDHIGERVRRHHLGGDGLRRVRRDRRAVRRGPDQARLARRRPFELRRGPHAAVGHADRHARSSSATRSRSRSTTSR